MIDIEILETHKNNSCFYAGRSGWTMFTESSRLDLFPKKEYNDIGTYLRCKDGWSVSRTSSIDGKYIKVGKTLFLQEEVPQFYA